ncbi:MAG: WD40 repeat domain-containing protein [candidate division Zixibacteria bacterium]|nr:WD40 repeat domain-containing protein [candidate division Zixibacteria bacterium]
MVRLWEAATWELAELTGSGNTIFADFSADGNYLAIGGSDGIVAIYSNEYVEIDRFDLNGETSSLIWSSPYNNLITGVKEGPLSYMSLKA